MLLILITTTAEFFPSASALADSESQSAVARLGLDLPKLIVESADVLHLNPETPEVGVQVNYEQYHPRAVNAADIWVEMRLTEPQPDEKTQIEVREAFDTMLFAWVATEGLNTIQKIAGNVFWTPGRGFLQYGQTSAKW